MPAHLFLAHVPVALLLTGAAADLAGALLRSGRVRTFAGVLLMMGGASAFLAFFTGGGALSAALARIQPGDPRGWTRTSSGARRASGSCWTRRRCGPRGAAAWTARAGGSRSPRPSPPPPWWRGSP